MFKWIFRSVLLLALILLVLILSRQTFGIWMTQRSIENVTSFAATISVMDIKLTRFQVVAKEISVHNPKGFCREPLVMKMNLVETYYEPLSLMSGEPHFEKLVIDINEVIVVRNLQGELNVQRLRKSKSSKKFQIDELILSLGKILYIDEKKDPTQPSTYVVNARNRSYKNIKSASDINKIVLNLVIRSSPQNLLELSPESLDPHIKTVSEAVNQGKRLLNIFSKEKEESSK
jgi:hypothetical protein